MEKVTGKSCAKCKYSELGELESNMQRKLSCKFGPPTTVALASTQGIAFITAYPDVTGMNPCYQWSSKEPANIKELH